jgi:hypothetical protein
MPVQDTGAETEDQASVSSTDEPTTQIPDVGKRPHDATVNIVMDTVISKFNWGNDINGPGNSQLLYLRIQEIEIPLVLQFGEAIILGREATTGDGEHPLDLTPFGGSEKGVSRRHAAIQRVKNSVVLMDLGSSNNTFINGQRIASHEPHILIEGDEIRLGNLIATISYGTVGKTTP